MLRRISHVEDNSYYRVKALDVLRIKVDGCIKRQPIDSLYKEMFLWKQLFKPTVCIGPTLSNQLPGLLRSLNLQGDRHTARRASP